MPVFDFNATPDEKKPAECTYTVIRSNENEATNVLLVCVYLTSGSLVKRPIKITLFILTPHIFCNKLFCFYCNKFNYFIHNSVISF